MKFDVITFGSATCDIYVTSDEFKLEKEKEGIMLCEMYGSKIDVEDCVMTTGGGATNAAVCFERMGLQAAVIGCVGQDYWGRIVKTELDQEGVSLLHLQATDKKPTSCSVLLVGKDGGRTALVHRAASSLLSWRKVDWHRLNAKWLYITSLAGDFNLLNKIIRLSREKQIKVAINPGNGELEQREKLRTILPLVEVLILNKQEFLHLAGKKPGDAVSLDQIISLGAQLTIITDGKRGTQAVTHDGQLYEQAIVKVKTVEETGAGDAFGSGFIAGLLRGLSPAQALQLAAYNAASVVEHIGPKAGLLFWPEVKKKVVLNPSLNLT